MKDTCDLCEEVIADDGPYTYNGIVVCGFCCRALTAVHIIYVAPEEAFALLWPVSTRPDPYRRSVN